MPLCGHFVCSLGYYRINCFIAVFGKLEALFPRETGQNIMLTDPAEQFVPLFDPEKKNPIGYTHGGKI